MSGRHWTNSLLLFITKDADWSKRLGCHGNGFVGGKGGISGFWRGRS